MTEVRVGKLPPRPFLDRPELAVSQFLPQLWVLVEYRLRPSELYTSAVQLDHSKLSRAVEEILEPVPDLI